MKKLPLLLVLVFAFFSAHDVRGSLVAHWTGDNTAVDATGNGHDGTLVGDTTYGTGQIGNAFSFDGAGDRIDVPANAALEPSMLSVSLWVQTVTESHIRLLIDSTHGTGNSGWALQINSANNLSFAYGNGSGYPEVIHSAPSIFDGDFHHIAATMDGTDLKLYVDGTLGNTLAYTGTPLASGGPIQLGQSATVSGRDYQGLLDDVRIYDHALSQSEISALAAVPEPSMAVMGFAVLAYGVLSRRRQAV